MKETITSWLIPCNISMYDPFSAFSQLKTVDWRQSSQVDIGDVVYIYCGKPYKKIMFKTVVLQNNIDPSEADKRDFPYVKTESGQIGNRPRFGYMRLQLMSFVDKDALALNELLEMGMNAAPQGPRRLTDELLKYIEIQFN